MYSKILVALDYSPGARRIFEAALAMARVHAARLKLVHVLTYEDEAYLPGPVIEQDSLGKLIGAVELERYLELRLTLHNAGLKRLTALVEEARAAGIEATFAQPFGSPEHVICKAAKEWNAEVIVLGRRGRSGLSELFLGSVSNHVVHRASCAVLILNPTAKVQLA
ncbi:MAG: universal stress protein [Aphanocapsa lilacina HA4352-LM1]|jgi:nucleotide-binding universal stress UspA family protein|nr:universal stress protein [Aphanocapsa lilacina HA4352-LM1]